MRRGGARSVEARLAIAPSPSPPRRCTLAHPAYRGRVPSVRGGLGHPPHSRGGESFAQRDRSGCRHGRHGHRPPPAAARLVGRPRRPGRAGARDELRQCRHHPERGGRALRHAPRPGDALGDRHRPQQRRPLRAAPPAPPSRAAPALLVALVPPPPRGGLARLRDADRAGRPRARGADRGGGRRRPRPPDRLSHPPSRAAGDGCGRGGRRAAGRAPRPARADALAGGAGRGRAGAEAGRRGRDPLGGSVVRAGSRRPRLGLCRPVRPARRDPAPGRGGQPGAHRAGVERAECGRDGRGRGRGGGAGPLVARCLTPVRLPDRDGGETRLPPALAQRPTLEAPLLDAENGYVLAPMAAGLRVTTGAELASPEAATVRSSSPAPRPRRATFSISARRARMRPGPVSGPACPTCCRSSGRRRAIGACGSSSGTATRASPSARRAAASWPRRCRARPRSCRRHRSPRLASRRREARLA